jgi:pimeloyl-ACP methyl ester carboxylesterase
VNQQIRFCKSFDGTRIAYAVTGKGPPLVQAPYWFDHLEYQWQNPVFRPWIEALSSDFTLVRMDQRGCGLSQRDVADVSFEALVQDLEAVADAAGFPSFALLGHSPGGALAMAYAVRHPERVSHLVLLNSYARGWMRRGHPPEVEEYLKARLKLMEVGWERDEPAYRQLFLSQYTPEASLEELRSLSELGRRSCSAQTAIRLVQCFSVIDISETASRVSCPALVVHSSGCLRVPFEEGRLLASLMANARLVALETASDILLAKEPSFQRFFEELRAFLPARSRAAGVESFGKLTGREVDILERMAQGMDNAQIAAHLEVSEKTVRNYITHIFDKLGVESRAQAIVAAREAGMGAPQGRG